MADSDEEYDRRRSRDGREKFRRERSDYDRHSDDRRKDNWDSERSRGGGHSRDWSGRGSDRGRDPYGRDRRRDPYDRQDMNHPPQKRMRRDWDYDGGHRPYHMPYAQPMHRAPAMWPPQPHPEMAVHPPAHMDVYHDPNQPPTSQRPPVEVDYPTQPLMLTFKQFLGQQEDNISDQDAIKKYNAYKVDFTKQQINTFFLAHKENEWFKTKFHPDECLRRKEATRVSIASRIEIFKQLFSEGRLDQVTVDTDKHEDLVKLLNTVIIKLEGGSDFDLTSLDMPEVEEVPAPASAPATESKEEDKPPSTPPKDETFTLTASPVKKKRKHSSPTDKKPEEPLNLEDMTEEQIQLQKAAQEFSKSKDDKETTDSKDKSDYSYSGSSSDSDSDTDSEPGPPGLDGDVPISETEKANVKVPDINKEENEINGEKDEDTAPKTDTEAGEVNDEEAAPKEPDVLEPRPLHKTQSIFLRHLAPSITKTEVEAICKRYPGFMRVALQDPLPDRNFFRRGWVTFDRTVTIRDICYNLNNIRLRECELNATINRELKQRVRPVAGITAQKQVIKQDIKLVAKVIVSLDKKWGLWREENEHESEKKDEEKMSDENFGFVSKNPVLKNITHYLVDEGSFEEEELIGQASDEQTKDLSSDIPIERDAELIKVLDRMILYLRIVHSVDYYSATEFPNEDEMPHRCGIMHARSHVPPTRMNQNDINEWIQNFENRIKHFLTIREPLPDKDTLELGRKDPDAEVEKFITANTQEVGKEKWLCPLSGKKFKGADFVRKHILNKHQDKIEEVKKEVAYFNNYIMDPKRPQLPEHPGNRASAQPPQNAHPPNYPMPHYPGMMYGHPRPPMMHNYGSPHPYPYRGGYGRDMYRHDAPRRASGPRRGKDPRSIIDYRDLDAPDDSDIF